MSSVVLLSAAWLAWGEAEACGPYLDHPRLSWVGDELLDTPETVFRLDLEDLLSQRAADPHAEPRRIRTREGDALDLTEALQQRRPEIGAQERSRIVERYLAARRARWPSAALPAEIPREFRLYFEAIEILSEEEDPSYPRSIAAFEEILALPSAERRYRSTWAAYMIAQISDDPRGWERVRELAREGLVDTLGLALASYRNEAYDHAADRPDRAIEACLSYRASGGQLRHTCDAEELSVWVSDLVEAPEASRVEASRDPDVAWLVASWLASRRSGYADWANPEASLAQHAGRTARWISAIEVSRQPAGAGRLGWAAYRHGRFEEAERLAALADPMEPMGRWLRAKLALRAGDLQKAEEELQTASRLFGIETAFGFSGAPQISCEHYPGAGRATAIELGLVRMAQDRYEDAIVAFAAAGDWVDAAYVAERVLETDELARFVDRWYPAGWYSSPGMEEAREMDVPTDQIPGMLRHLLARRLAREGRWEEALRYYPWGALEVAEQVVALVARGEDPSLPEAERGAALFDAALLVRRHGWELLATEVEPDFRVVRGVFELDAASSARVLGSDSSSRPFGPTKEELARLSRRTTRGERYQYLYAAYDLAERALPLLPDDSDALAVAACTAGSWMSSRDVQRSSEMWLVLLRRAHTTAIGRSTEGQWRWWGLGSDGLCGPTPEGIARFAVHSVPESTEPWRSWGLAGILLGALLLGGLWGPKR